MKNRSVSYRLLLIISILVLAAVLIPLFAVGACASPCADDYSYGYEAHRVFLETGSAAQALFTAVKHVGEVYKIWQGTFSAVFLFSVQPAVFSEKLYFLTGIIMLSALTGGIFALVLTVFRDIFGLSRYIGGTVASVITIVCTQLLPSPVQGFFWYNGAVYYTFFFALSLIAIALGISFAGSGKTVHGILLCFLCAMLGGGNYVTALSCVIIGVSSVGLLMIADDQKWKRLIVPVCLLIAAFSVSISAPGNAIRQSTVAGHPGVFEAILASFKGCIEYSFDWFSLPLFAALLLLSPLLWDCVGKSVFAFRLPGLVSLYSFCLLSAMFCPPIYALGNIGEFRLLNIIYFAFVLLTVFNLFYWLGWIRKRFIKTAGTLSFMVSSVSAILCAVLCLIAVKGGTGFTSIGAVSILRSGEAQAYKRCADERLIQLKDASVRDAVLDDYPSHPFLLFYDDITPDPDDWRNEDMASFYGKASVTLRQ